MGRKTFILQTKLDSLNKLINTINHNKFAGNGIKQRNTKKVQDFFDFEFVRLPKQCNYSFHWHMHERREDPDNIASAVKFIFDGMQKAQIIPNDNWDYIKSIHHYFYADTDKNMEFIEIEVTWDE